MGIISGLIGLAGAGIKYLPRLGKKIAGWIEGAGRLGSKALGSVSRVGGKVVGVGQKVLGGLSELGVDNRMTRAGASALEKVEKGEVS